MNRKNLSSALLGGLVGGLLVFLLLALFLAVSLRNGSADFITFAVAAEKLYRDVEVLEHELRGEKLWVRYRNRGGKRAEVPQFHVRQFRDGRLVDEYALWGIAIAAEEKGELILDPVDDWGNPRELEGSEFEVRFVSASE